jgi:hypothetical protein
MTPGDAFERRVDRSGSCHVWLAGLRNGYGRFKHKGVERYAHRWAWEQAYGPIPPGMMVLHRCDNPPCVRLEHLFLGTHADNMRDASEKGRLAALRGPLSAETKAKISARKTGKPLSAAHKQAISETLKRRTSR